MATVADYIVISDDWITLKPSPQAGPGGEKTLTIRLPANVEVNSYSQHPLLMFKARTKGNINAEINVNANKVRDLVNFQSSDERTIHEVMASRYLRPGGNNDIHFRVVSGDRNAEFIFGDVVLWFQREGFGPN